MPSSSLGSYAFGSCGALLGESNFFSTEDGDDVDVSKVVRILSWRGEHTYSDWTIIVTTSEVDSRTYHVHKSILSVGPRSSQYFSKLFLKKGNGRGDRYNQSQSTKIELDGQDADLFPLFLDFMYDIKHTNDATSDDDESLTLLNVDDDFFTTSNAVSLRHLAKLFDCEGLKLAVNKFIGKDLSFKTGPVYLLQAHLYEDDRLIKSAKRSCIENFSRLDTRAITRLPLELFRSILTAVNEGTKNRNSALDNINSEEEVVLSCHLSEVVCQYFEKHPDRMNVQLLLELTNETVMPKIASEPAIGFTALVRELNPNDVESGDSDEWRELVALCQRCAHAVVEEYGWKDFNVTAALEEYTYGSCCATTNDGSSSSTKLDSLLFATSFAAALDRAQSDIQTKVSNNHDGSTTTSSSKKQMEQLQQQNDNLRWQNQSMKKEVGRYKDVLAGTKDELLQLRQQVKELEKATNKN